MFLKVVETVYTNNVLSCVTAINHPEKLALNVGMNYH